MKYRVLLLDLFGTLVHFRPQLPTTDTAAAARKGRGWLEWVEETLARERPGLSLAELVEAVGAVSREIVAARPPEYYEVPSRERFRRALTRLGVSGDTTALAARLSDAHMQYLAEQTDMPAEYGDLLGEFEAGWPLALISNFDHGPAARGILRRFELDRFFRVTLISAEFGRRKPHPAIFEEALRQLGAKPSEALHVGDTLVDDVHGARAAGIDVAWIDPAGKDVTPDEPRPTFTVGALREVLDLLRTPV